MQVKNPRCKRIAPRGVQLKALEEKTPTLTSRRPTTAMIKSRAAQQQSAPVTTRPSPRSSRRAKIAKPTQSLLLDPHCIEMRNHIFETGSLEDYELSDLELLASHLREYSAHSAITRNYDEALKAESLGNALQDEIKFLKSLGHNAVQDNSYEAKKSDLDKRQAQELEDYDNETIAKHAALEHKQQHNWECFEELWHDRMPSKYQKPSSALIRLIEIEKRMSLSGLYKEAAAAKVQADLLQEKEMAAAQKLLLRDYTQARHVFLENQAKERALLEDTRHHWREVMLARHKTEQLHVDNRGQVVQIKESETKPPKECTLYSQNPPPMNGNTMKIRRKPLGDNDQFLLPNLIPPNDNRMKEQLVQKKRNQRERNKMIKENLHRREHPSEVSTPRDEYESLLSKISALTAQRIREEEEDQKSEEYTESTVCQEEPSTEAAEKEEKEEEEESSEVQKDDSEYTSTTQIEESPSIASKLGDDGDTFEMTQHVKYKTEEEDGETSSGSS